MNHSVRHPLNLPTLREIALKNNRSPQFCGYFQVRNASITNHLRPAVGRQGSRSDATRKSSPITHFRGLYSKPPLVSHRSRPICSLRRISCSHSSTHRSTHARPIGIRRSEAGRRDDRDAGTTFRSQQPIHQSVRANETPNLGDHTVQPTRSSTLVLLRSGSTGVSLVLDAGS